MRNIFIICDTKDGKVYININYITCFWYDSETDMTELFVQDFDNPFVFHGDVTDDIVKMIYS